MLLISYIPVVDSGRARLGQDERCRCPPNPPRRNVFVLLPALSRRFDHMLEARRHLAVMAMLLPRGRQLALVFADASGQDTLALAGSFGVMETAV